MLKSLRKQPALAIPAALIGLALLAYLFYFIAYNQYAFALFRFPFDYDQGEGFELVDTLLFSQGKLPYRDNNHYPFYSSNYPPVFHLAIVPLVWAFGPRYWTGRFVAWLGTLITAALIGWGVQKEAKRWWLSVISGLAYLASNYVYHVGPLFRQHLFMVMFETAAVVWVSHVIAKEEADGKKRPRGLLGVMVLLLLAGYTKQLAYATVIAVFGFLFLRDWKRSIKWALPFAAVTGLIFLLLNVATNGHWYIATVIANINAFVPGQAQALYKQWFQLHTVLIVVAALYFLYQLYFERLSVYSIWFLVATLNGATAGKWGAGESYFTTAIAAACVMSGIGLGRVLNYSARQNKKTGDLASDKHKVAVLHMFALAVVACLYLVQAERVFHTPTQTSWQQNIAAALGHPTEMIVAPQTSCSAPQAAQALPYSDVTGMNMVGPLPTKADTEAGKRIAALIAEGETAALAEDAGFNLWLGRDVVTNPTQLLNLYNNNEVDISELVTMIDEQAFDTIVLRAQFYPPPVLERIGQRYETIELIQMHRFVYCVMRAR